MSLLLCQISFDGDVPEVGVGVLGQQVGGSSQHGVPVSTKKKHFLAYFIAFFTLILKI